MKLKKPGVSCGLLAAVVAIPSALAGVATTNSVPSLSPVWQKPAWLTDLAVGVRESYDDNILLVSGSGLQPHGSWVTGISPKLGFNAAPLLNSLSPIKALTLVYAPDINIYHNEPSESYDAQRVYDFIKVVTDEFSFNLTNSFLYNNGSTTAPIYALNQTSNTNDRYRNFYAQAVPRERMDQFQDRGTVSLQYNWDDVFIRPTATTLFYDLNTVFHNAGVAPYIGYQNWPDRYDVNGGLDMGYKVMPSWAVFLGYRYGYQYQQQFPEDISPTDRHFSSSRYERVLAGIEGNIWSWLNVKAVAGPDFRDYNSMAAVNDDHMIFPFVEASSTVTFTPNQSISFTTKEWQWVASTGLVPYYDSTYALSYHWNATSKLGLDLGEKFWKPTSPVEMILSASNRANAMILNIV